MLLHILVHFLQIKSSVVTILGLVWSWKNLLQEAEYEQFQTTRIDTLKNEEAEAKINILCWKYWVGVLCFIFNNPITILFLPIILIGLFFTDDRPDI